MMNLVSLESDRLSSSFTPLASLFSWTVSIRSVDRNKSIRHNNFSDTFKYILIRFTVVEIVLPFQKHLKTLIFVVMEDFEGHK